MKKNIIFLVCITFCLSSLYVRGQTEKGKFMIGGSSNLKISFKKYDTWNETNLDITPQVSYFIANNLSIGFQFPFYLYDSGAYRSTTYSFSPFLRHYFFKNNLKPFAQAAVGIFRRSEKWDDPENQFRNLAGSNLFYEFKGGLAIFLNKTIAIDLSLGYHSRLSKDEPGSGGPGLKSFNFEVGFSIVL